MQLHIARLCLDCNEVHDSQRCPVCGSEAFAYLTRWVPAPERRVRSRPTTSPEADVFRDLIAPPAPSPLRGGRLLKRGALGLTVLAAAGWAWRWNQGRKNEGTNSQQEPAAGDSAGKTL